MRSLAAIGRRARALRRSAPDAGEGVGGHSETVGGVDIRGDGLLAASGSDDGTVKLWDSPSGTLVRTSSATSPGSDGQVQPGRNTLLSASGTTRCESGTWPPAQPRPFSAVTTSGSAPACSSPAARACSARVRRQRAPVGRHDRSDARGDARAHGKVFEVASTELGKWAVTVDADSAVSLWDFSAGNEVHAFSTNQHSESRPTAGT